MPQKSYWIGDHLPQEKCRVSLSHNKQKAFQINKCIPSALDGDTQETIATTLIFDWCHFL